MTFFKRWAPRKSKPRDFTREDRSRGSPSERGYGTQWKAYSEGYRRMHPFCIECGHRGRIEPVAVVDHKIPARLDPGLFWEPDNHWGLCLECHGWKYRMERYAEKAKQVDKLILWCDSPESRPKPFRAGATQDRAK